MIRCALQSECIIDRTEWTFSCCIHTIWSTFCLFNSFPICDHNACVFSKRFFFCGLWDNGSIFHSKEAVISEHQTRPFAWRHHRERANNLTDKSILKGLSRSNQPEEWMRCVRRRAFGCYKNCWTRRMFISVWKSLWRSRLQPLTQKERKNLGPRPADPGAIWTP